jgi:hypothetical protein
VALTLVAAVLVLPAPVRAWSRGFQHGFHGFHHHHPFHHHFFGGFAVGVFTGAVVGSAFAPVYAYPAYPAPVYGAPAPMYAAPPPPVYWYYCRSLGAYYPYVPSCPEAWLPVPAQP